MYTARIIQLTVHGLCGLIALTGALAVIYGTAAWLVAALGLLGTLGSLLWHLRREFATVPRAATTSERRALRRSRTPGFHKFLMRQLGDPHHPARMLHTLFIRPLSAPTFSGFWQSWNPVYRYFTLFWFYRPLRRHLPRQAAVYLTFIASGLLLHDLPFNLSADIARGQAPIPAVTLLFAIFGGMALVSEVRQLNLAGQPTWVRIAANLVWLGTGFELQHLILALLPS